MYIESARQWDAVRWNGDNLAEVTGLLSQHGLAWEPFVGSYALILVHDIADPREWTMVDGGKWLLVTSLSDPNGYGRVNRDVRVVRDDGAGAPLGFTVG